MWSIGTVATLALAWSVCYLPNAAHGCPYLNGDETSLTGADLSVHPSNDAATVPLTVRETTFTRGAEKEQHRRLRMSMRDIILKFLNRLDIFNLFPNPSPPKAPTQAPVAPPVPAPRGPTPVVVPVAVPTPVAVPVPTPVAVPTPTAAPRVLAPVAPPVIPPVNAQLVAAAKVEIQALSKAGGHAGKLVQLAFHDCVGGCDGCVDLGDLANKGLNVPISVLEPIVTKYTTNTSLTRADIWALAGLAAAESTQRAPALEFTLTQIGRPTCSNMTGGPVRSMPSAHLSTQQVLDYFALQFGFSQDETTAIMGAHSLGRAAQANTGFDGPFGWDSDPNTMDNGFYTTLVRANTGIVDTAFKPEKQFNSWYTQTQQFPDQFLWRLQGRIFMLNADMAMAVDLAGYLDPVTGAVNCSLGATTPSLPPCPSSRTLDKTVQYARNQTAWVHDFRNAYAKMLSMGCNATVCTTV